MEYRICRVDSAGYCGELYYFHRFVVTGHDTHLRGEIYTYKENVKAVIERMTDGKVFVVEANSVVFEKGV